MTTVAFSMRMDKDLKLKLERLAKVAERSSSYLVGRAVEQMVEELESREDRVREAFEYADDDALVSEELVDAWVRSWPSDKRLQRPSPDMRPNALSTGKLK
jgi:predicted transcriptional regulator